MSKSFQRAKGIIGMLLATLLLTINTLTIAPAPAKADCRGVCGVDNLELVGGQVWAFGAGLVTGVLISGGSVPAAAATVASAATAVAAAPVVAPVAIGTAAIGGAYLLWQQFSHPSTH